jgi:PKD repeat protein
MRTTRRSGPVHGARGRHSAVAVAVAVLLAVVIAGCNGTLPSGLPSLPPVPSLGVSIPPLPTTKPTPAPTAEPTEKPTAKPTPAPTEKPTAKPTAEPTEKPAATPTAEPTEKPTAKPTAEPTPAPTPKPTAEPTKEPTAKPAATPTAAPTPTPSPAPTPAPTPATTASPSPTYAPIQARFAASTISGPAPLDVRFEDLSGGTIAHRFWTFGDGDSSLLASPAHTYKADGLYTVTLTVWGPDGRDTRIKENLIAVGSIAELLAENQDPAFTDQPAFWLTLAVSPPLAAFLAVRDHIDRQRSAITSTTEQGDALATLIVARNTTTTAGAVDLALESFMNAATRFRHRLDGSARDNLDQAASVLSGLRDILLFEKAIRQVDPNDPRLTDLGQQVTDRLDQFNAAIDQLEASGE